MDPNSSDLNNPLLNQPQGGGYPEGQYGYRQQSPPRNQQSGLSNQHLQNVSGSPHSSAQAFYQAQGGANQGQGSNLQYSGTPQGFGYTGSQHNIQTSNLSQGNQWQVGGPPIPQSFGSGQNIQPAPPQGLHFENPQNPSNMSHGSIHQQVNRSMGMPGGPPQSYNNIPQGQGYSGIKEGFVQQTVAPSYDLVRTQTYQQTRISPAGVSSHMAPAPPPQPTTVTSVMETHSIQNPHVPQYESRNLSLISQQIRQSSARIQQNSSRMMRPPVPPPPPPAQIHTTVVQTTTTSVSGPVPAPQEETNKKVCYCCPRWLCILLGILLLLGLLAGLFFLIRNLMSRNAAAVSQCPLGSVKSGDACVACPQDQVYNGSQCIKSSSSAELNQTILVGVDQSITGQLKEQTCPKDYHRANGKCIKCPPTSTWNGVECWVDIHYPPYKIQEPPKPVTINKTVKPIVQPKIAESAKPPLKQKTPAPEAKQQQSPVITPTIQRPEIIPHCQSGYIFYQGHCVPLIAHAYAPKKHHLVRKNREV